MPAKFVRELTAEEIANIKTQAVDTFEVRFSSFLVETFGGDRMSGSK